MNTITDFRQQQPEDLDAHDQPVVSAPRPATSLEHQPNTGRGATETSLSHPEGAAEHAGEANPSSAGLDHHKQPLQEDQAMTTEQIEPQLGSELGGGFYAGRININGQAFALIVAPKAEGERAETNWIDNYKDVPGALSYFDGLANTKAMAEAGSALASWSLGLRIAGCDDWYLPSQDELEILYRNLKPTTETNGCYARSGINLSAIPPARPYTPDFPLQTQAEAFVEGGAQEFETDWYWSSMQHASDSNYAWVQFFDNGYQIYGHKSYEGRARAVRRLPI